MTEVRRVSRCYHQHMGPRTRHVDRTIQCCGRRPQWGSVGHRGLGRERSPLVSLWLNTVTGTWTSEPDMTKPLVIGIASPCSVGNCGSLGKNKQSERFDAVTNLWIRGPDMPTSRLGCNLAVFRGILDSCEYLDVASNTWMAYPPMITPCRNHGLAVLDGQLWAHSGGCHSGSAAHQSCERLDATANAWVAAPTFPCQYLTFAVWL